MISQFDASFTYTGPILAEVQAAHTSEIEQLKLMPSKLANAKLHANNEVQRWVLSCNRLVWGAMPANAHQPTQGEIAALLEQLSPEKCERLLKESQMAAEARHLFDLLSAAEAGWVLQEEFEAYDAAGKEARFQAWRAGRSQ
jgi:hypothetical protein